jgi:hypothetical protein
MAELGFAEIYADFDAPIASLDCGESCAPYNERGVPFCCDIQHAVPTAYQQEWEYLKSNTNLWHIWEADDPELTLELAKQAAPNQMLIECQGHVFCQRNFRAITCRAFPFYPYITREGEFVGISYYWEYENRCWVISNLDDVSKQYLNQFITAFEHLFTEYPDEWEQFRNQSILARRVFGRRRRAIPVLHRNGQWYKITPRNGHMRKTLAVDLPKFGPYKIAAGLPFHGER